MEKRNKIINRGVLFFVIFYSICCFLSLNRHSKDEVFNYHSEIFADKAEYYIYLPALFIYDFKANQLPYQIDKKTGSGFIADTIKNKILTKVTYGVALLESPFFIVTHLLSKKLGYPADGFSIIYNRMIDISGVFYAVFAVIFLYFFLIRYVASKIAVIVLSCLFFGTNLFYYSIFETGMSHIYSFFLFSVFLFLSGLMFKPNQPFLLNILFGVVIGLIIMVRPINVIFLPVFLMFNQPDLKKIKKLFLPFLFIGISAFIVIIPQLIYWKYASGNYLMYAYPNEGFTNLFSPKILNLWFSTNNGLVIFSPLVILLLSGIIFMRKQYPKWSLFLIIYFILISYIFSSWWCWNYGCSYGSRPFVEYYVIFSLPFCFFVKYILEKKVRLYLFAPIVILCVAWNLKLIFSFDGCWYGGDWDWKGLVTMLLSHTK